jgi:hypothetical protein
MAISTMVAALALQTLPAPDTVRWEAAGEDQAGRYAIDPASIVRDGDVVRFLLRAEGASAQADGTNLAVVRYEIDCRARTVAAESADFYRQDGTFAYTHQRGAGWGEPEPIGRQRSRAMVFRRVCPGK